MDVEQWYGLFAPGGTPPSTIGRLNQALNQVLRAMPHEPSRGRPDALAQEMQRDLARWRKVVAEAGIAPKEPRLLALE